MLLIGAGSGLAPLRGFIEDRVLREAAGEPAGPMALFFGCDHPDVDFLYHDELAPLAARGALALYPAFSRQPEGEVRFVQDRLWQQRSAVAALLSEEPLIFVCGNAQTLAKEAVAALGRIYADAHGTNAAAAAAWVDARKADHTLVLDVFG